MFPSSAPAGGSFPSSNEPGEFTKMLQTPGVPPSGRPQGPPQPMFPPSSQGGVNEPGEFTRMLEAPFAPQGLAGQPLAAPPPRPQATGEATRAFQAQQAQAQGGAPVEQGGPSEFTKMFKAPAAPPPAPPEPKVVKRPAGRPPIPKKKGANKLLWILIAIAVVLALALIIYLIAR
jgi:hypothetical protein